jgi:hypothetical protein
LRVLWGITAAQNGQLDAMGFVRVRPYGLGAGLLVAAMS